MKFRGGLFMLAICACMLKFDTSSSQDIIVEGGGNYGFISKYEIDPIPVVVTPSVGFSTQTNIQSVVTTFEVQPGFYIGVLQQKSLSDKVTLEYGFRYTHYRYTMENRIEDDGSNPIVSSGLGSILLNGSDFGTLFQSGAFRNNDGTLIIDQSVLDRTPLVISTPTFSGSVNYIEAPININYSLGKRINAIGGFTIGAVLSSKRTTEYTLNNDDLKFEDTSGDEFKTLQLSTNLGVEYNISSKWGVQFAYKYYITRLQNPNLQEGVSVASTEHIHALNLGVRYRIQF